MKRDWLTIIRKKKNLTQKEVAEHVFVERSYYTQIENGSRNPSQEIVMKLSEFLQFDPSAFYLEEYREPFSMALKNVPIVLANCDVDLRYTWIYNPHKDFLNMSIIGKKDEDIDDNDGIEQLVELKKLVLETKQEAKKIITFPLSDGMNEFLVFASPLFDSQGNLYGVTTASVNITNIFSLSQGFQPSYVDGEKTV